MKSGWDAWVCCMNQPACEDWGWVHGVSGHRHAGKEPGIVFNVADIIDRPINFKSFRQRVLNIVVK